MDMNHWALSLSVETHPSPFVGFSFTLSFCLVTTFVMKIRFEKAFMSIASQVCGIIACMNEWPWPEIVEATAGYGLLHHVLSVVKKGQNMEKKKEQSHQFSPSSLLR